MSTSNKDAIRVDLAETAAEIKRLSDEQSEAVEPSFLDISAAFDITKLQQATEAAFAKTWEEEDIMDMSISDIVSNVLSSIPTIDLVGEIYATEAGLKAQSEAIAEQKKQLVDIAMATMNNQLKEAVEAGFDESDSMTLKGIGKVAFTVTAPLEYRDDRVVSSDAAKDFFDAVDELEPKAKKYLTFGVSPRGVTMISKALQNLASEDLPKVSSILDKLQMNMKPAETVGKFTIARERKASAAND